MTDIKTNDSEVVENEVTEEVSFDEQIQDTDTELQVEADEEVRQSRIERLSEFSLNVLPIVHWPDERLKQKSAPLTDEEMFSPETDQLIGDMFTTLAAEQGIGLSAIQVGIPKQIAVFDFNGDRLVIINPEILSVSEQTQTIHEGCISVPGVYHNNDRPATCDLRYVDLETGTDKEVQLSGVYAFAVQHEIDHMEGKVFVENFSFLKRSLWKNKVKKIINKRNNSQKEQ